MEVTEQLVQLDQMEVMDQLVQLDGLVLRDQVQLDQPEQQVQLLVRQVHKV
jgi:hypothetical protein